MLIDMYKVLGRSRQSAKVSFTFLLFFKNGNVWGLVSYYQMDASECNWHKLVNKIDIYDIDALYLLVQGKLVLKQTCYDMLYHIKIYTSVSCNESNCTVIQIKY